MSLSKEIMNDPDLRLYLQRLSINAMWGTRVSKNVFVETTDLVTKADIIKN